MKAPQTSVLTDAERVALMISITEARNALDAVFACVASGNVPSDALLGAAIETCAFMAASPEAEKVWS